MDFTLNFGIKFKYSANYYPQGNGLAESTNKNLINIIKKIVAQHQRSWHINFPLSLRVDRVTPKATINNSPFFLVYGQDSILPTHIFLPSLQLS